MRYDEMLFKKYNSTTLNKKQVANELGISISTLDRAINNDQLPIRNKRIGDSLKARYVFPLKEIAAYLDFVA